MDGNGINDYFHFRFRHIDSHIGFFDPRYDIIIYINNERISTRSLYPNPSVGYRIEFDGVNVIISLTPLVGNTYVFTVNRHGEIDFRERIINVDMDYLVKQNGI